MHALVRRYCPSSVILILMNSPAASNGQSLLETMFVLFVVAMLCSAAVSGLHMMQTRVRIQAAAEDMLNTVLNARTEALRREKRISICVAAISSDAGASVAPAETPARCAGANALPLVAPEAAALLAEVLPESSPGPAAQSRSPSPHAYALAAKASVRQMWCTSGREARSSACSGVGGSGVD
jgi:type II secretory pathway pseudopilin PulG